MIDVGQVAQDIEEDYPEAVFPMAVFSIGEAVDPATRTIKVRVWMDNAERKLKPEMYALLIFPLAKIS